MDVFEVTCRHCGELVMVVARIGDAELAALAAHVVANHRNQSPLHPSRVVDILAHFTVHRR